MNKIYLTIHDWKNLSLAEKNSILERPTVATQNELSKRVREIISLVRCEGDASLIKLTSQFDKVELSTIEVTELEKNTALDLISKQARKAIERARVQIETFHQALVPKPVRVAVSPGLVCEKIPRPVESVGLYIPGGTAPLPSTVLMLGIPAALAQCPKIILCSPPRRDGTMDPHILFAAELCGIHRIFKIGGAQAISAMAYGTTSVPKVDKIFGPGNAWVTEAKMQVAMDPKGSTIDMPAGPSEVLVLADANANPEFVAADLLSQAEHGVDSQAILISDHLSLIENVMNALEHQIKTLPRRHIAEASLKNSRFILVSNLEEGLAAANEYAPEHLILQVEQSEIWAKKVFNAGSVFIGPWSPEAMGDYASGTNHVLPTYGLARSMSGVSVDTFMKYISFQSLEPKALQDLGQTVIELSEIEGLHAHGRAVAVRLNAIENMSQGRKQLK